MSREDIDTRIGWIGLGVMGVAMCGHLIDAGYRTSIQTRSREKAADLEARRAARRENPAEVATSSDITIAIVEFLSDMREVFLAVVAELARQPREMAFSVGSQISRLMRQAISLPE